MTESIVVNHAIWLYTSRWFSFRLSMLTGRLPRSWSWKQNLSKIFWIIADYKRVRKCLSPNAFGSGQTIKRTANGFARKSNAWQTFIKRWANASQTPGKCVFSYVWISRRDFPIRGHIFQTIALNVTNMF